MKTNRELKQQAKDLLRGHWGKAVGLNIIPLLLGVLANLVTPRGQEAIQNASYWRLVSPNLVIVMLSWAVVAGVNYTLLDWVRTPGRPLHPTTDSTRVLASTTVFPIIVLALLSYLLTMLGLILLIIPGVIVSLMLAQTVYIYKDLHTDKPQVSLWQGITQSLSLSEHMMRGHKWELFVLQLSFIGWFILGGLSFGIGLIWILPYYNTTMAAYYDALEEQSDVEVIL
ncbi:DUF975 family protein [Furfurilactobacillus siliginis]|uniref:Membrane protein n=1 Tax=Furfurilactobacillus siliginis TaxID=348151 RepID=A0A0R2L472_9LACO|nr:DUF975 family protein [Furfurilactobacillus siliginis]KRN96491.1 integral membrane protein [Furfurilactobacillus siliginis]GEK29636.1 membrane protein [Furfurilactobacillus siliginis]